MQTQLHFICLTGNFRKGVVRLNCVAKWVAASKRLETTGLEVLRIFTRKILVSQLNIRGVCRCHASINLFWLRKIWIVLFVTKQYQPFCVRTGGDALVKVPCSGVLPRIEVGRCYLRKWRRGESLLFILKQAQSMLASAGQPQQHYPKQHSKVVTPQEPLLSIIQFFAKVFRRLHHLPMK